MRPLLCDALEFQVMWNPVEVSVKIQRLWLIPQRLAMEHCSTSDLRHWYVQLLLVVGYGDAYYFQIGPRDSK